MAKKKRNPGGRPTVAARDAMVPLSISVPGGLRRLLDAVIDEEGGTRSSVSVELLGPALARKAKRIGVADGE